MKRFLRKAFKATAFVVGTTLFTFVAVPTMEVMMTSLGSRSFLEWFACFVFACWYADKLYTPKKARRRERPNR